MKLTHKTYRFLRDARKAISLSVAAVIFVAVAFGYDLWLCRWQMVPAAMAGVVGWLVIWSIVTAVAGRIYCSSVCPFGTMLDVFGHLGHLKKGYFYSTPRKLTRRSIFVIALIALLLGIPVMFDLLDPASAFSRIAAWSFAPLVRPVAFSLGAGICALVTISVAGAIAASRGRLICNTVCPVGTFLAEISRFSIYHIDINTDKCIGCGRCTERCKAECIDPSAHTVDPARCVLCFNCTAACQNSAITYRRGRHRLVMPLLQTTSEPMRCDEHSITHHDPTRREFIASLASLPALLATAQPLNPDLQPLNPVHPPGLLSASALHLNCTACGACSATCPTGIIRPTNRLREPLRPVLDFDNGPCVYDCTRCTQVCPTGALTRLTVGEKHIFVIGKARVVPQFCIEYTSGQGCGECARRCPRRAISIDVIEEPIASPGHPANQPEHTPSGAIRRLPQVDNELCIGCGACHYYCPTRPSAFIIEGEN